MDEDSNFEDYITRFLEERLNIHLPEQQVYSYSDSKNVLMSVQHNLPVKSFPLNDGINVSSEVNSSDILEDSEQFLQYLDTCTRTENVTTVVQHALPGEDFMFSSQYNRVPQETLSGVPNFSTPAFAGLPEIWNTEQLGMNQSSSNFVTIQPQGGDLLQQNLLSYQFPTSDDYFSSEVPASERYPAVTSTSERFHVSPYDSVVNEPFSVPNLNHFDNINESSSKPGDKFQGYIDFDHLDFMNCPQSQVTKDSVEECQLNNTSAFNQDYSEERFFTGRQNSTVLSFNSPGRFDTPSGNASCYNQNPTSLKILDIPRMCSSSNKSRGDENLKHDPNARSNGCGKIYATKGEVIRHKKVKHGTKESLHCDYCGKRFLKFSMLESHLRLHTGEKPFMCAVCNKGFSQNSNLRQHERTHTGEKPFVCNVCNKGFAQSSVLRRHERTHTGDKPYMCKVCNTGYSRNSHLRHHQRTHTGEKPFLCLICNKRFMFKTSLRRHERTHKTFKYE